MLFFLFFFFLLSPSLSESELLLLLLEDDEEEDDEESESESDDDEDEDDDDDEDELLESLRFRFFLTFLQRREKLRLKVSWTFEKDGKKLFSLLPLPSLYLPTLLHYAFLHA